MSPKRPRTAKPAIKPESGQSPRSPKKGGKKGGTTVGWRLYLLLLGLATLLAGLVWLAQREAPQPQLPAERPAEGRVDQTAAAREQAEAFLAATAIPAGSIMREPADAPRHYQIRHRSPTAKSVEELRQRLRRLNPPLLLVTPEDGVLTIVDDQGKTLLTIQYLPAPVPPKVVTPPPGKGGRVAIIVDDLGRGLKPANQLLAIRQPVTFAILPIETHAAEVARLAHEAGREVMLHIPMEPQGFPVVDPGDDALLVSYPDEKLRERMNAMLTRVPYVAGINNHMGSRFTEDERAMTVIMAVLRERRLFFVDSLTSGHSVGTAVAGQAGVPTLRRDVFLDNVAEVEAIVRELRRLADKARRNGGAIGICHPYPETLKALQMELPKLAAQGVEFVTVAELLAQR